MSAHRAVSCWRERTHNVAHEIAVLITREETLPLLLNNREVAAALSAGEYVEAMEEAFRELGAARAVNSLRVDSCVPLAGYTREVRRNTDDRIRALPLDADPVYAPSTIAAAKETGDVVYRLKTITGGYPACGMMAVRISTHFDTQTDIAGTLRRVKLPLGPGWQFMSMVVLLSLETGEVLGMLPDSYIQKMRVGGTTALGVKLMARPGSRFVGVLGSGAQAEAAVECTAAVLPLACVRVFSPTAANRERFARQMSTRIGVDVVAVDAPEKAFEGAEVVLTATSSYEPVYKREWLRPGMHLGIGTLLEDDPATFSDSRVVVVSLKPFGGTDDFVQNFVMGAKRKATFGELINRKAGEFDWSATVELGDLLNGRAVARERADEITHHLNNNGCGMQFAAAGARILANARRLGLGIELSGDFFLQKEHT
jgi:ornithine cyclodeaminase/alanine dehydrogenase-like protein (mu-crystallin family)